MYTIIKPLIDGQSVRLRLLEPMRAGEMVIPRNALVTGMGKVQGDRLGIDITSLEYAGTIIPIELARLRFRWAGGDFYSRLY